MKKSSAKDKNKNTPIGPTQRQLRAGELVRHALVEILREQEIHDEDLVGVSVTITEVRVSPDLRHAHIFVEPLGAGLASEGLASEGLANESLNPREIAKANLAPAVKPVPSVKSVIEALNRHAKFLRGVLGRSIEMKFTPDLKFLHDVSFNEASRIDALFMRPDIARDLHKSDLNKSDSEE